MIAMIARITTAAAAMIQPMEVVEETGLTSGEGDGEGVAVGESVGIGESVGSGAGDAEVGVTVGDALDDVGAGLDEVGSGVGDSDT